MKPGLILIDIQNDYFEKGKMELVRMDRAAENAKTHPRYRVSDRLSGVKSAIQGVKKPSF